jgi:hypothetical protein
MKLSFLPSLSSTHMQKAKITVNDYYKARYGERTKAVMLDFFCGLRRYVALE